MMISSNISLISSKVSWWFHLIRDDILTQCNHIYNAYLFGGKAKMINFNQS